MRLAACWTALAALFLVEAALAGGPGPAVGAPLPPPVSRALAALSRAVADSDRAAAGALLQESSRAAAAPLLELLVPGGGSLRREVELRVAGAQVEADGSSAGRLVLVARVAPAPAEAPPPPLAGDLVPEEGLQSWGLRFRARPDGALVLEAGLPASVVAARLTLRAPEALDRLAVRTELDLVPEAPRLAAVLLQLPPGLEAIRVISGPVAEARWLRPSAEAGGGQLLLELAVPAEGPLPPLVLEHEGRVTDGMRAGARTLYLPHGALIAPWGGERFHLWDLTLDLPASVDGVSIGTGRALAAPEGRRRVRYVTDRPIDYPGLAIAPFRVDRLGSLELWRVARVGGAPERLLGELSELVAFHEERVGPLPYGAFRLVEVDMPGAGAVSYASVIFMKTAVMATAKKRFAILAHEVAHQWWGNAVQGDQHSRWLSEGMANALMDLFVREREGEQAFQDLLDEHRERSLESLGPGTRPLADVSGRPDDYYHRGALFVHGLRESVGEETFWRILSAWYEAHAGPEVSTADLRGTAERVAGRSLAEVFEPWLGTTALPELALDWTASDEGARLRVSQRPPAFPMEVPIEALLAEGRSAWRTVRLSGPLTELDWELGEKPLALRLDPTGRTARVRADERGRYLLAEAGACLARGETERGLSFLKEHEASHGILPPEALAWRSASLALAGDEAAAAEALAEPVQLMDRAESARLLLAQADRLLERGAVRLALPLLEALAERVDDGAAVPLRLGRALHLAGRFEEAEAAWRRALEARPESAAARLALGLPAKAGDEPVGETLVDVEDRRLDGNHPESTRLFAASDGRWGLALSGSRRLFTGRGDELHPVPDFHPSGLLSAVVAEPEAKRPLIVSWEGGLRRGRLTVLEWDESGRARVRAVHGRTPGAALALATDGRFVHVAWRGRDGGTEWQRFLPPLRGPGSEGPDDLDGLRTLKPSGDARFEPSARTPRDLRAAPLHDGTFAWLTPAGALESEGGLLWEELERSGSWQVEDLRNARRGAALLLAGDRSRSPFPEDARRTARLVLVGPERLEERELPADALQAVEAPDGSLLVLRGFAGCGSAELRVSRWPAPSRP